MEKEYKGTKYIVYWHDKLECFDAYVKLPDNHLYQKFMDEKKKVMSIEINVGYDSMEINCHGGLTFSSRVKKDDKFPQGFSEGSWIGWDYGHDGDKTRLFDGKEWTEEEVEEECKNVIDQLLKI